MEDRQLLCVALTLLFQLRFRDPTINFLRSSFPHSVCNVRVDVQGCVAGGVTQDYGQRFYIHSMGQRVCGETVPIGYNKDKSGIPVFSRLSIHRDTK